MKYFLNIVLNSTGIGYIFGILRKYKNTFITLVLPIILCYVVIYSVLFLASFILWKLPSHIPIPFVGDMIMDRLLILAGVVLAFWKDEV